jgi:nitrous oxide reductase accessory protein NosL
MRIKIAFSLSVFLCLLILFSYVSAEKLDIEHPIKNPKKYTQKERCDNCGMDRNKWARTRHEFETSKGKFYTCSIHCVAAMDIKLKEESKNVKAAEYLYPERMLDAEKAFYVIGSTAPGTMTPKSKIAFSSKDEAEKFAKRYGGVVGIFKDAMSEAYKEIHNRGHH